MIEILQQNLDFQRFSDFRTFMVREERKSMKNYTLGNSKEELFNLLPNGKVKKVKLGEKEIAILRLGEEVFGFEPFCPHRGASLLNAYPNSSGELICPLHEYRFNLKSGRPMAGACRDLETYSCILGEGGLEIQI